MMLLLNPDTELEGNITRVLSYFQAANMICEFISGYMSVRVLILINLNRRF